MKIASDLYFQWKIDACSRPVIHCLMSLFIVRTCVPQISDKPVLSRSTARTRTRTGLSRPQTGKKRPSSALISSPKPWLTSSPRQVAKPSVKQTPIRRSCPSRSVQSTPEPLSLASSVDKALVQQEESLQMEVEEEEEEEDSLNVSIADLVKTRQRGASREYSQTLTSSPRTPQSRSRPLSWKSPP